MSGKCKAVFTRGPNKGKLCGRECKGKKCPIHTEKCGEYRSILGISKRYDNLVSKNTALIIDSEAALRILEKDKDIVEKKLYGVRLFLKDDGLVKIKDYKYIPFAPNTKHNAAMKKKTLIKKRGTIIGEMNDIQNKIDTLQGIKKLYSEHIYEN
jgi:hypothetical protein